MSGMLAVFVMIGIGLMGAPLVSAQPVAVQSAMAEPTPIRLDAYARARLAAADANAVAATSAFRQALMRDPANVAIARRAYRQAIIAGDMALALQSVHLLDDAGSLPRDGLLLLAIDALQRNNRVAANLVADRMVAEEQLPFFGPFIRTWTSVGQRDYKPPSISQSDPFGAYGVRHIDEQTMLQRLAMGDGTEARSAYIRAKSFGISFSAVDKSNLAIAFARLKHRDVALDILSDSSAAAHAELRMRIEQKKSLPKIVYQPQYGIALLLNRLANDLGNSAGAAATLSLLRIASFADPASENIRLDLAKALLASGYTQSAYAEAGKITASSPAWLDAQIIRVGSLARMKRQVEALDYAKKLASRSDAGSKEQRLYAEQLRDSGDYAGAALVLAKVVQEPEAASDMRLLQQYGAILEKASRWDEAKAYLKKALSLQPENAAMLNHLGYSMIEHGDDLPAAIDYLEKANKLQPDVPAYMDSLGWAYFKAGRVSQALPFIEKAAVAAPREPDISDHLGDVLYAFGRKFEARNAWTAATILMDEAAAQRVRQKIEFGVGH
jgi:tetratricopeptide (TPR) repeat protein